MSAFEALLFLNLKISSKKRVCKLTKTSINFRKTLSSVTFDGKGTYKMIIYSFTIPRSHIDHSRNFGKTEHERSTLTYLGSFG